MVRLKSVGAGVAVAWALLLAAFSLPAEASAAGPDASGKGIVYLLRGGLNVFSTGMDDIAAKLRDRGINARSIGFMSWQDIARDIAEQYQQRPRPIVVGGHSFGANAALLAAAQLGRHGIPVALVILFDPTDPMSASANVARVVNFVSIDSLGFNVDVKPAYAGQVENILHMEVNHMTIDNNAGIQNAAVDAIAVAVGAGSGASAQTQ
jgi:pimeloyl-ACP methyl ester carboxylesterase